MSDNHLDFKIDYKKIKIFDEANTDNIKYPLVLSVPHKGQFFPEEFLNATNLSQTQLRKNEDAFVDELVMEALKAAGREDLIGFEKKCLIRPRKLSSEKRNQDFTSYKGGKNGSGKKNAAVTNKSGKTNSTLKGKDVKNKASAKNATGRNNTKKKTIRNTHKKH